MTYSRDRALRRITGRQMRLTGRATLEGTAQDRRAHAGPLPAGRGYCPLCWRDYSLLNGFPRRHGCRPAHAVVFLGPLPPPKATAEARSAVTHASGVFGDGKARCGASNPHVDDDSPTCRNCLRRLAHEVRSTL